MADVPLCPVDPRPAAVVRRPGALFVFAVSAQSAHLIETDSSAPFSPASLSYFDHRRNRLKTGPHDMDSQLDPLPDSKFVSPSFSPSTFSSSSYALRTKPPVVRGARACTVCRAAKVCFFPPRLNFFRAMFLH